MSEEELKKARELLPELFKQITELADVSTEITIECNNGIAEGPPDSKGYSTHAPTGRKSVSFYFYVPKFDKTASLA